MFGFRVWDGHLLFGIRLLAIGLAVLLGIASHCCPACFRLSKQSKTPQTHGDLNREVEPNLDMGSSEN